MGGVLNTIRLVLAVLLLATGPPAVTYWFIIHPWAHSWRRRGVRTTYFIVTPPLIVLAVALFRWHEPLLGRDLDFSWPATSIGVVLLIVSGGIKSACSKVMPIRVVVGLPEVSATQKGRVITEGVFSRVRHPRYLSVITGVAGAAAIANYVGIYVLIGVMIAAIYPLTVLEERELVRRFGQEYEEYRARVPRLIPKLGRPSRVG